MTRLIIATVMALLAGVSESGAQSTEIFYEGGNKITIRQTPPPMPEEPLQEATEADVDALTREEARFIWESLSQNQQRIYRKSGSRSFKDLPMDEKKKLVGRWQQKKNTKYRLITPHQAERMHQQ